MYSQAKGMTSLDAINVDFSDHAGEPENTIYKPIKYKPRNYSGSAKGFGAYLAGG